MLCIALAWCNCLLPASSRVHNSLSSPLAKCIVEVGTVVLGQVVARERLTSVLVNSLKYLEENVSFQNIG